MYKIVATAQDGSKTEVSVISKDLCQFYIGLLWGSEDFRSLIVTDGLTGEIMLEI